MDRLKPIPAESLGLLISYRCNSGCSHCLYCGSPKNTENWMGEEDVQKILDGISSLNNKVKTFNILRLSGSLSSDMVQTHRKIFGRFRNLPQSK